MPTSIPNPLSHVPPTLHLYMASLAQRCLKGPRHKHFSSQGWLTSHTRTLFFGIQKTSSLRYLKVSEKYLIIPNVSRQNASHAHFQMRKYVLMLMMFSDNILKYL